MRDVAVAVICKTPAPGQSKTRLSPPLQPEECAELSACFIQDLTATIDSLVIDGRATGYAVYTPLGSEGQLRGLLPRHFGLVLQSDGDLGKRLNAGITALLDAGHRGAILVNSDSPTLPRSILDGAIEAIERRDCLAISPAIDGGYTLIGLAKRHQRLFEDIPWSTDVVYRLTLERAREIGLPVVELGTWYDVDDANSYAMLENELSGIRPHFSDVAVSVRHAANTLDFISRRRKLRSVA